MYKEVRSKQEINGSYSFKQTEDERWGIYLEDRLLATVGTYEACQSIGRFLGNDLSREDSLKAAMAFKNSINKSLIIG